MTTIKKSIKKCPRCGKAQGNVYAGHVKLGGAYVRYRRCPKCHWTWTGIEIPLEEYKELTKKEAGP